MDNIKHFIYKNDTRYLLKYHTDMNDCIKHWYWYNDIKNFLISYNCIMIDSIEIPMNINDYSFGVQFLKEFCNIMTAGDRVIIFDTEELLNIYNIDYIYNIEQILARCNFINIPIDDTHTYEAYIYLNAKGNELLTMIDAMHGVYYD